MDYPVLVVIPMLITVGGIWLMTCAYQEVSSQIQQFQFWFRAPLSSVLDAPSREEAISRLREMLERVERRQPGQE